MTAFNPWQWFCSTRTFSNGLETTMTITALYFWPWKMSTDSVLGPGSDLSQEVDDEEEEPASAKPSESKVFHNSKSIKQ